MGTVVCVVGFGLTVVLAGCGMHEGRCTQAPVTTSASAPTSPGAQSCPLAQIRGIDAVVADMNGGVAVTFMAPPAEVSRLRQNVLAMATANDTTGNAFAACACGQAYGVGVTESMPATSPATEPRENGPSADLSPMPRATAASTETATGAVLELRPRDATQLVALRTAVKEHIHALRRGCLGGGRSEESR